MGAVYYKKLIEGVTVPAVVQNGNYYLIQMAVYEDGTVSCWHRSSLKQFQTDLQEGWVVSEIPLNREISVYGLGFFRILDARWSYPGQEYYRYIETVVRSLNPEMSCLYHPTSRELEKWKEARVNWGAFPTPCKLKERFGYQLLDGDAGFIFYRKDGKCYLTSLTAYADKTLQIEAAGEQFFTPAEIDALFEKKILFTAPETSEWVIIKGLGELLLSLSPEDEILPIREKQKEIADMLATLSGEQDSLDHCREIHYQYLCEPTDWLREKLREAYEAVPEHKRMFLGDMDTKDHDFIRIIYDPNRKREV